MNDAPTSFDAPGRDRPSQNDPKTTCDAETKQLNKMEWRVFAFGVALVIVSMFLYFINATCKQIVDLVSTQNDASLKIS
jgi:hypothetical protein